MKYMGSKRLLAKHILPIILNGRKSDQWYVEPFVGGGNMIDKVDGLRLGADYNKYLIAMFQALQLGWLPPEHITKEQYYYIKGNKDENLALTGYCGFCASFCGKWFGGWANDYKKIKRKDGTYRNYQIESRNNILKQLSKIEDLELVYSSYDELEIPPNSIIYCDPPYKGKTKYKDAFNSDKFYQWFRDKADEGHTVYLSEYSAPDDFILLWEKEHQTQLSNQNQKKVERLYTYL